MRIRSLRWVVPVVLGFLLNLAVRPAFAQTPPPAAAPTPPGPPQPYAYPPPPPQGYPPPGYPPPGYPPPPGYAPAPYPYAPYQLQSPEPSGPPPMIHTVWRGFLIAGLVTFGVGWGVAVMFSSFANDSLNSCYSCSDERAMSRYLWIPVAGPMLAEHEGASMSWTLATTWSLGQAVGVAMTIVGISGHDVPAYGYGRRHRAMLDLVPTLSATSQGFALRGTF